MQYIVKEKDNEKIETHQARVMDHQICRKKYDETFTKYCWPQNDKFPRVGEPQQSKLVKGRIKLH